MEYELEGGCCLGGCGALELRLLQHAVVLLLVQPPAQALLLFVRSHHSFLRN